MKLLFDGQQRMTSLYGVVRGRAPKFLDDNAQAFTGLRFHLDTQTLEFYQPPPRPGNEDARKACEIVGASMTREQIAEAQARAREWANR